MPRPRLSRPVAIGLVAALALSASFAGGFLVGRPGATKPTVLGQAEAAILAKSNVKVSAATLNAAAVQAMLGALNDKWAAYYGVAGDATGNDELRALLDGRYSGLGVWLRRAGNAHQVEVASVVAGSPAASSGLLVGDSIEAVNGLSVADADVDAVAQALQGPTGSAVVLMVHTAAGALVTVHMTRSDLAGGDVISDLAAPGVVRIRIAMFSAGVGAQVQAAVAAAQAEHARGIILDLRGNPGGLLSEALTSASAFLDGGPVVTLEGRSVPRETLDASGNGDTTTPLAVLVDGGTASAAEILAGALQDRGRAVLVGSRTFGKGDVQQVVALPDGSSFELTVAQYLTPDGHAVDGVGLTPDVAVGADAAPSVAITRALALLDALVSSPTGS